MCIFYFFVGFCFFFFNFEYQIVRLSGEGTISNAEVYTCVASVSPDTPNLLGFGIEILDCLRENVGQLGFGIEILDCPRENVGQLGFGIEILDCLRENVGQSVGETIGLPSTYSRSVEIHMENTFVFLCFIGI